MFRTPTREDFDALMLSGVLKKDNQERCIRVFYDAAKVIHYRQERLNKSRLKMNQIASALLLVDFYHSSMFRFVSDGPLACNFGNCPEDKAVQYFGESVMGVAADVHGRNVQIEERGLISLYKEPVTGKHHVAPENYEFIRGKRLPWIRHVLRNSPSIYLAEEKARGEFRRSYLYTSLVTVPFTGGRIESYFLVVVREENGVLRFVTAFPIGRHNGFLARIEPCAPFLGVKPTGAQA
jgi:hypothetical protein